MIKRFKVVLLDDHIIFQEGLQRSLDPEKKKFFIQKFQDSNDAFLYIKNSLDNGHLIDLILTDFAHKGDNGYEFAKSVRLYESSFSVRIPILLLTMHSLDNVLIRNGLNDGTFNAYLPKSAESNEIQNTVKQLINF